MAQLTIKNFNNIIVDDSNIIFNLKNSDTIIVNQTNVKQFFYTLFNQLPESEIAYLIFKILKLSNENFNNSINRFVNNLLSLTNNYNLILLILSIINEEIDSYSLKHQILEILIPWINWDLTQQKKLSEILFFIWKEYKDFLPIELVNNNNFNFLFYLKQLYNDYPQYNSFIKQQIEYEFFEKLTQNYANNFTELDNYIIYIKKHDLFCNILYNINTKIFKKMIDKSNYYTYLYMENIINKHFFKE